MTDEQPSPAAVQPPSPVGAGRRTLKVRPEGVLPKVVRLATFLACVTCVFGVVGYRRVRGQLGESLLGAGAQMAMVDDVERQDAPRRLLLNGQEVHFSTGVSSLGVDALLDRFEARCEQLDAGLMEELQDSLARRPDPAREASAAQADGPVLRDENGGQGYVACVELGRERVPLASLLERVQRFEQSHDLHDLGDLRYLYAEPMADGERTHFVTVWTEGSLRFDAVFPEEGDAQGSDLRHVPRPPGSRRTLSAFETGDAQRAIFYETDELDEGALGRFYRRELPGLGWTLLESPDAARPRGAGDVTPALVAQRGTQLLWMTFSTDLRGRVRAAFVETGAPDAPGRSADTDGAVGGG